MRAVTRPASNDSTSTPRCPGRREAPAAFSSASVISTAGTYLGFRRGRAPRRKPQELRNERVVARPAVQDVVPRAADQGVVAVAAGEAVVAVAAVDRQRDRVGCETGRVDDVVPAERVDSEAVGGNLGAGHVDGRRETGHGGGAGASRRLDVVALL